MALSPPSPGSTPISELINRIESMSLEEVETMKASLTEQPFQSATTTLSFYASLLKTKLSEENIKNFLHNMHTPLEEYLETYLSPNQLIFCYWYRFTIAAKEIDPQLALFQSLCLLACKVLTADQATQNFTQQAPASDWIEALQAKLGQTKNLKETLDAFTETKTLLENEAATPGACPLQRWHTICHLLTKAFPDIRNQREKAITALIEMPSRESIIRASLGLTYLFEPPTTAPISYDSWATVPEVHLFTVRGLLEIPFCAEKEPLTLGAIGALLGESITSPTFYQKIQDQYLELFVQIAEGPTLSPLLVVPLIERLLEPSDLYRSEVLAAIDQALQHIVASPCEFHTCARIYPKLFAFFDKMQKEGNWQCYEEDLTPLLANLSDVRWDMKEVFSPAFPLIKREVFASRSFQEVRRIIDLFKSAKATFPDEQWPKKGLRCASKYYLNMLTLAIKKICLFKRVSIQPERLRQRVAAKNALVIELINTLYSLRPPLKDPWPQNHLLPLCRSNITLLFDSELIFHKKGDRLLIGRRDLIKMLDPLMVVERNESHKYPSLFPRPPGGSFVRRLCVRKIPPSSLSKVEKED